MYKNSVLHEQSPFLLVRPIVVFSPFSGVNFSKTTKCTRPTGSCTFVGLWKIYSCLFIPNCTRKIMWLPIQRTRNESVAFRLWGQERVLKIVHGEKERRSPVFFPRQFFARALYRLLALYFSGSSCGSQLEVGWHEAPGLTSVCFVCFFFLLLVLTLCCVLLCLVPPYVSHYF